MRGILPRMSVKATAATLITALVLGFIIFNFENWLEWKGLDSVFIDAEKSVAGADWSVWAVIVAFMTSSFMTGFAIAALIFGFWDIAVRATKRMLGIDRRETANERLQEVANRVKTNFLVVGNAHLNHHYISELRKIAHNFSSEKNTLTAINAIQFFYDHIFDNLDREKKVRIKTPKEESLRSGRDIAETLEKFAKASPRRRDRACSEALNRVELELLQPPPNTGGKIRL